MGSYHRPRNLKDALALLDAGAVTIAAGCTDLFAATQAQALPGPVLDITALEDLRGVTETAQGWRIGAATTWTDVFGNDLPPAFDMLKLAAREVGSVQIQNAGTIAGNICNASPAADGVPALLALDAEVETASQDGSRRIPLAEFITGVRQTALRPNEMVSAVHIPRRAGAGQSGFRKLGSRKYLVISIAMAAVRVEEDAGVISRCAIAVGACSPVAARLPRVEAALIGCRLNDAADAIQTADVLAALSPITDLRGSSAYRKEAAAELVRRVLRGMAR